MDSVIYLWGEFTDLGEKIIISVDTKKGNDSNRCHLLAYSTNAVSQNFFIESVALSVIKIFPIPWLKSSANSIIALSDNITTQCFDLCGKLNNALEGIGIAVCDLSACNFIIISESDVDTECVDAITKQLIPSNKNEENDSEYFEQVSKINNVIEASSLAWNHNKYFSEFQELIYRLCSLDNETLDRRYEGLQLAWLVFNTLRSDTALRNISETGAIKSAEDYASKNIRDIRYSDFKKSMDQLLSQIGDYNYNSQIWAILNFCAIMRDISMGEGEYKCPEEIQNDFIALYPIINDAMMSCEELYSVAPIQYSPWFSYSFLYIPYAKRYCFWDNLRQLLHEFFHYIPVKNRKKRNEWVLAATVRRIAISMNAEDNVAFQKFLYEYMIFNYERLNDDSLIYQDSMSFVSFARVILDSLDIESSFADFGLSTKQMELLPNAVQQSEYIQSYTYFLREVRSDISMMLLLNENCATPRMGMKEYITLMAKEKEWASLSADQVAYETILRFGFMIEWIKEKYSRDVNPMTIIDGMLENKENLESWQQVNLVNMQEYLKEYEKEIAFVGPLYKQLQSIVEEWTDDNNVCLKNIVRNNFWKQFLEVYDKYLSAEQENDQTAYIEADFGIRLLLTHLPQYEENLFGDV